MFNSQILLLDSSIVITGTGGETAAEAAAAETSTGTETGTVAAAPSQPEGLFGAGAMLPTILIYGALIAALYFFMIRPQRKREKEMKAMQASIGIGDNVLTSSGMYGSITAVGEDCFVVEFGTNKGVRIPVRKSDVVGVKTPVLTPVNKE
ncbi:MAG: preprotein translocase subunit YajC [Clostridiales bacterium]|nr:preprotein translocase subunit YajC [Clostridiales bacterium]